MAYRLRYTFNIDWIGAGMGPMGSPQVGPGNGNAQTLDLLNTPGGQNIAGSGAGGILAASDITTLTNAAAADMAAQLNLAVNLGKAQGFATGQP
jgi:hypothetical protein